MADNNIVLKVSLDGAEKEIDKLASLQKGIDELAAQKKALNKAEKDLAKEVKAGTKTQEEARAKLTEIKAQQVENTIALKVNRDEQRKQQKALASSVKAQNAKKGSLEQLKHQLSIDTAALDKFTLAELKTDKGALKLQKRILKTTDALKKQEGSIGNNRRNVGNYGEAMNDVLPIMGSFGGQIMGLQRSLGAMKSALAKVSTATQAQTVATEAQTVATATNTTATATNTTATRVNTTATKTQTTATKEMTLAQKAMATSTNVANKGLKLFKIALAATGIGLIVVALGSMVAALASTQKGMDAMNRVLEPIKETFATLFGIIQDVGLKVFDSLKTAIKNPQQTLKNLGNAIKENLINRFTGAVGLVKAQAKLLVSSFTLMGLGIKKALADVPLLGAGIDQEQLKKDLALAKSETIKNAKDVAQSMVQVTTGMTKEQQNQAIELTKTYTAEGKKRLAEAAERGRQIADLEREIEEAAIGLNRERARANRAFETQKEIAQNVLKTDKERLDAVKEAKRELSNVAKVQQDQLKREIELATLRTKANDTDNEAKKELSDLQARLDEVAAAEVKKRILLGNLGNTIVKKRIALNKKAAEDVRKELDKLNTAREKASQNEVKRNQDAEKEILSDKEKSLQLEAKLEELAIEEKLKNEKGLEKVTAEDIAQEKFNIAINLERKLADLRIEQNKLQSDNLLKKETELQNKLVNLRKESDGKETVETIKLQDELNAVKQEKERVQGAELTQIKLENKVAESEILGEEEDRQKEVADEKKEASDEAELAALEAKEEGKQLIKNAALQAGEQFVQEAFNNQNRRIDEGLKREVDALNLKREAGEISAEEFEKKRLELDKKAFQDRKKLSQVQNAVDFAVGAGKTVATLGFANPLIIPTLGALAIEAAAQSAIIASQKFSRGGVLNGASHAQGGVNLGNNQEGEGGEAIINKRSTAKHLGLLSAINQDGGGVALTNSTPNFSTVRTKFANGGVGNFSSGTTLDLEELRRTIIETQSALVVKNVASETTGVANRVQQIEDSASF